VEAKRVERNRFTDTLQGVQKLMSGYRIFTMSGYYRTDPDSVVNILLPNYIGKRVWIELDPEGRVVSIEPA
jgi:hypothetical protein